MMCVLAFVGFGHVFLNDGRGTWFHKACIYDCGHVSMLMRINYTLDCPAEWGET